MEATSRKLISVVTPCWNEEGNVEELARQIRDVFSKLDQYDYEHIFIDNRSTDGTEAILRRLASSDPKIRVIFNNRNFGHIRSPFHGFMQAAGAAVIVMVSDLQDPPALIADFIRQWEAGYKIVLGQKVSSQESKAFYFVRSVYYKLLSRMSDVELPQHVTGFGLYDREVVEELRKLDDRYPYVRGLVAELGYDLARIPYEQPIRRSGFTKNNLFTLYDLGMLGLTSHSRVPLRLAAILGFAASLGSLAVAVFYFVYKLIFWGSFAVGIAPLVIGLFLFASVQLMFIGLIGEYLNALQTQIFRRPYVVERERLNFPPQPRSAPPRSGAAT